MNSQDRILVTGAAIADLPAVVDLCMMVEAQHEGYSLLRWKINPGIRERYLGWMTRNVENAQMLIAVARDPAAAHPPHIPQTQFHATLPGTLEGAAPNLTNVVGALLVGIMEDIPIYKFARYAYIHDIAVATDYRRRGVATRLLAHGREWANAQGLPQFRLMVADANTEARAAFERAGFQVTYQEMILPLDAGKTDAI